jgi:hypothetical protein
VDTETESNRRERRTQRKERRAHTENDRWINDRKVKETAEYAKYAEEIIEDEDRLD